MTIPPVASPDRRNLASLAWRESKRAHHRLPPGSPAPADRVTHASKPLQNRSSTSPTTYENSCQTKLNARTDSYTGKARSARLGFRKNPGHPTYTPTSVASTTRDISRVDSARGRQQRGTIPHTAPTCDHTSRSESMPGAMHEAPTSQARRR